MIARVRAQLKKRDCVVFGTGKNKQQSSSNTCYFLEKVLIFTKQAVTTLAQIFKSNTDQFI